MSVKGAGCRVTVTNDGSGQETGMSWGLRIDIGRELGMSASVAGEIGNIMHGITAPPRACRSRGI